MGLKPQNHMMLEYKHSREIRKMVMENGHSETVHLRENGVKENGHMVNGDRVHPKHLYLNGDAVCFEKVKEIS